MTKAAADSTKKPKPIEPKKFGTFQGVFTPSILTVLGVIMYLRMGWVLGNVGLIGTVAIITIASVITFLTSLSISMTATNMKVGGGGAYYMVSRSLGVEAGASVGLPLYLAQAIGIAFYLAGFAESVADIFPDLSPQLIAISSLILLTVIAALSADFALKIQFVILAAIIFSLVSFFAGEPPTQWTSVNELPEKESFWVVFAVFFPAVTGILSGVSMSGDLKDPMRSLPLGTIGAVVVGYVVYTAIPIYLSQYVPEDQLLNNPMIMRDIAMVREAIYVGIWGATLSSALGSLLAAPRTLQALARDRVVFRFLGKGFGVEDAPRIATVITFMVALIGIVLGDLNAIAPVLSMFFLTSYGVLNFIAGIEGMIANPSWRPNFKVPWPVSVIGGFSCFAVMFMIDAGATIISLGLTVGVYYFMQKRELTARWGDMRRGILVFLARYSISKLALLQETSKSWRPNILVLSGTPTKRWYLIELADAISHGKGFLSVATIIPSKSSAVNRIEASQKSIEEFLRKRNVPALVRISVADDVIGGVISLVQDYGLGPIVPNTIILGETEHEDNFTLFAEMLIRIYQARRNIVIVRQSENLPARTIKKRIDVWWGRKRHNAGLSMALGYMLQISQEWKGSELHLKSIATKEDEKKVAEDILHSFLAEGRLSAKASVVFETGNRQALFNRIRQESTGADLVFIGMLPPDLEKFKEDPEATINAYAEYYRLILELTKDFPPIAIVLAAEDVDFHKIFVS